MLSSEFVFSLYEYIKIFLNMNNMKKIIEKGYGAYNTHGLSFAPDSMVISILQRVLNRTANTFDIRKVSVKNGVRITINRRKTFDMGKLSIFQSSIDENVCRIFFAVNAQVLEKVLELPDPPSLTVISKVNMLYDFTYEFSWKKRERPFDPVFGLSLAAFAGVVLFANGKLEILDGGTAAAAAACTVLAAVSLQAQLFYRRRVRYFEKKLCAMTEEYDHQFDIMRRESADLIIQRMEAVNRLRITEIYTRKSIVDMITRGLDPTRISPERRDITVMFCDICRFTDLSEQMDPMSLVHVLNEYFNAMNEVIIDAGGEIDKLIGDYIMALFPGVSRALSAATSMRLRLDSLNESVRTRHGSRQIDFGIGIHCGEVVAGNIGSSGKMDYTVIGDIVNAASRLESLTRQYGVPVLLSGDAVSRLDPCWDVRFLDIVLVKGKKEALKVYESFEWMSESEKENIRRLLPEFRAAQELYLAGDFADAREVFMRMRKSCPAAAGGELSVLDCFIERCRSWKQRYPVRAFTGKAYTNSTINSHPFR